MPAALGAPAVAPSPLWLLSLGEALPLRQRQGEDVRLGGRLRVCSGPEGGFSATEEALMRAGGARAVHLGSRVLRSETAPLAVLSAIGVLVEAPQGV